MIILILGIAILWATLVESAASADEYLQRWTPGGDTNAFDLPYRHRISDYEREGESDWRDDRWQKTVKGPLLTHTFLMPNYELGVKSMAVQAGPGNYLLYDLSFCSFVAGTIDGELRIGPARFGLLNRPQLAGEVVFYVPAEEAWRCVTQQGLYQVISPIGRSKIDYRGCYLQGDRVLQVSEIDGVEVLESAATTAESGSLTRELQVSPRDRELRLIIASANRRSGFEVGQRYVEWNDRMGNRRYALLDAASKGVRLSVYRNLIELHLPASANDVYARICYGIGDCPRAHRDNSVSTEFADLAALRRPGPRRWSEPIITVGKIAPNDAPLVVDHITVPHNNSFQALFYIAGLGFFKNGDAAVCTAHGDVWIVRGLDENLKRVTWQRFATGLYQPLGIEVVDDKVYVLGRDQITRLHDNNDDGEADYYESFNNDLVDQGQPHAYAMRLDRVPDGSFLFLKSGEPPHGSALLRVNSDGKELGVVARGFRHPFGLGVGPRGEITVADNEGNWVPSSKIDMIAPEGFYGYLGSAVQPGESPPARPLCYMPKVADNSSGGQFWNTSKSWTPYHRNGLFHFSWGRCTMHAVLCQPVEGTQQAATVQVPGVQFVSGPAEAAFHPLDGQLYVVSLDGWQTAAKADGCFERVRYTGKPLVLPCHFAAYSDGIELKFTEPLDRSSAEELANYQLEQWNYNWSGTYDSYHFSLVDPKRVGHDKLLVERVKLSVDGKRLFLITADLKAVDQLQISIDVRTAEGAPLQCDLYATIHKLDAPRKTSRVEDLLQKDNLVAWCIVPFDVKKRGPEERAVMLEELEIRKVAYDWWEKHLPTFAEELEAYERHGISLHAVWTPVDTESPLSEPHWQVILDQIEHHKATPELWVMLSYGLLENFPESDRPQRAAEILAPVARAAAERNCQIGLYNHGGWFGEPENQIRIIEVLRTLQVDNVGLVYNFHHGHDHVDSFPKLAKQIAPYLLTVNISGIQDKGPKILPFAAGDREIEMLQILVDSGYRGPLGILDHREELDARQSLQENLDGVEQVGKKLH